MKSVFTVLLLQISFVIFAQDSFIVTYPDSITENANAIVKTEKIVIDIPTEKSMRISKYRVVTVYNELGLRNLETVEYFDKSRTIKSIEGTIYNASGKEIKRIRRKDFTEQAVSQGSIATDNRVLFLEYTPVSYPFTMVYESEISSSTTAFLPTWMPVDSYFLSVLHSSITVQYGENVRFKYKEIPFNYNLDKKEEKGKISFTLQNFKALRSEEMAAKMTTFLPSVLFGLDEFQLEGVMGNAESWASFGKWMYEKLLSETEEIPVETITTLTKLIGTETDPMKKAKIIYEYMQSKTRYVSIQLGIGGWKPMLAKDVDRLGYGDCKALTNYTRSLLKVFNIPSYYALVYSGSEKRDITEDFVSMQGTHAILGIPNNQKITWLECTSQSMPFGFQGDFTDDRKVLIVSENDSKIVKTASYLNEQNLQKTHSKVVLNPDNSMSCEVKIVSSGIVYDEKLALKRKKPEEVKEYYTSFFNIINNKKFTKTEFKDASSQFEFTENIQFNAEDFVKNIQDKIILPLNSVNQYAFVPKKNKDRKTPFEINRGYCMEDESIITIPSNLRAEALPEIQKFESEFGTYVASVSEVNGNLIYKRKLVIKSGFYAAQKFESYRKFRDQIARAENSKIILIKKL